MTDIIIRLPSASVLFNAYYFKINAALLFLLTVTRFIVPAQELQFRMFLMCSDTEAMIIFYHSVGLLLTMSLGTKVCFDGIKRFVTVGH